MKAKTYRAFISYNRAEAAIASALAAGLTRFARPWYSTRAMRVFLDKSSLPGAPSLSAAIERGLAASEWMILLASKDSARSPWVRHEVEWWLAHRGVSKLIIARTGGEIVWQGDGGRDFDWGATTALPLVLKGRFATEPLWADLEAAAAEPRKTLSNPVFRDAFLVVAAQIHGMSKDALWNAEQAEQRKRIGFAAAALAGIVAFAWVGYNQYAVSMDRKENLASIQLGAKAFMGLADDPQLAARIALAGVALRPSGIAASALRSALARIGGDVPPRFESSVPGAVAIAYSPDAKRLAVLVGDGRVVLLDALSGRVLGDASAANGSARAIAWGADGTLAIGGDAGLRLIKPGDGGVAPSVRVLPMPAIRALAFSVDGQRVALAHDDGSVRIVSTAAGASAQNFVAHAGGVRTLAFSNDGQRLATGGEQGEAALWAIAGETVAAPVLRLRLPQAAGQAIVSVDFNREGGSTVAEHMLAAADAGGAAQIVDADAAPPAASRALDLPLAAGAGVAARFVQSGRCLARASATGVVEVAATLGFEPLFTLGQAQPGGAPTIALAMADTSRFALLDAAGRVTVYEQPLCGDAEAICGFADGRLTHSMSAQERARWVPGDLELGESKEQPPGPLCRKLIDRLVNR